MTPVLENSYAAIWVPVPDGMAVAGVRWYNNDGAVVFPRVLVASGTADTPVGLSDAIEVASDVQGTSLSWSQVDFAQPFACHSAGLYCLFEFPQGSEYEAPGAGGGAAIGYTTSSDGHQGWLCADAETWMKVEGATGLAIDPVFVPALPGMTELSAPHARFTTVIEAAQLQPAAPNPFNPQTVLEFSIPAAGDVDLVIYDVSGRLVHHLVQGMQTAGTHSVTWQGVDDQGRRLASGVYFARFVAAGISQTQRLVLVK